MNHRADPELRAVLFDAGDTLLRVRHGTGYHYAAAAREIAGFDMEPEDYDRAFLRVFRECMLDVFAPMERVNDDHEERRWRTFTSRLYGALGLADHHDALWRRLLVVFTSPETWEPFPDTRPTLESLRAKGLRLAVVSNWSTHLLGILEHHDLVTPFEAILASCDVGHEKPDPRIFHRALERIGVRPEERSTWATARTRTWPARAGRGSGRCCSTGTGGPRTGPTGSSRWRRWSRGSEGAAAQPGERHDPGELSLAPYSGKRLVDCAWHGIPARGWWTVPGTVFRHLVQRRPRSSRIDLASFRRSSSPRRWSCWSRFFSGSRP
jgi:putative hydrolase of the HAD superfamily